MLLGSRNEIFCCGFNMFSKFKLSLIKVIIFIKKIYFAVNFDFFEKCTEFRFQPLKKFKNLFVIIFNRKINRNQAFAWHSKLNKFKFKFKSLFFTDLNVQLALTFPVHHFMFFMDATFIRGCEFYTILKSNLFDVLSRSFCLIMFFPHLFSEKDSDNVLLIHFSYFFKTLLIICFLNFMEKTKFQFLKNLGKQYMFLNFLIKIF